MKKRPDVKSHKNHATDPNRSPQKNDERNKIERLVRQYFNHAENHADGHTEHHPDNRTTDPIHSNFREEEILTKLKARIASQPSRKPYRLKVAASLIGFICLSALASWFYLSSVSSADTLVLSAEHATLEPGGNRATLTLADGTVVDLSNHRNGQIASQEGAVISKPDDGMLIYEISDTGSGETIFNSISTPSGGQFAVVLPDGSKVWLNAESELKYPTSFSGDTRTVELIGEGYFEIKSNKSKPFTIKSNNQLVTVLGTKFNINSYADEPYIKTTLLEGSVQIVHGAESIVLKPGEQARVKDGIAVNQVETRLAMAWKEGDFIFKNDGLQDIMKQIGRWYNVEVDYEGNVDHLRFGGIVSRSQNLATVLTMLEKTGRVKFELLIDPDEPGDNKRKRRIKVITI